MISLVGFPASYADAGCTSCGETKFPEATAFLECNGYPASQFTVLINWNEVAPNNTAKRVAGYHVLPRDGSAPFDLYSDDQGNLLTPDQLKQLGVHAKNWNLRPREATAQVSRGEQAAKAARRVPVTIEAGVPPSATAALPKVDLASILKEDAAAIDRAKGVIRTGVFQDLPAPIEVTADRATAGNWTALPDNRRVWSMTISSPEATGMRIHFKTLHLTAGARVTVYNAADPSETYAVDEMPYQGDTDVWAPTCFGEAVVLECVAAANSAPVLGDPSGLAMNVDRIVHMYKSLDTVPYAKSAGSCNLDVSCYPDFAQTATGVGGIGTIGINGALWCTGSLLVNTDPATQIPYFLTAHHCVPENGTPSSIEVYWLYQTPGCNLSPPSPASVPRSTGGADLLQTAGGTGEFGGGNDFSLLRLRQGPPAGVAYLGWSTVSPMIGLSVVVIHHPEGDYKRIAFGELHQGTVVTPFCTDYDSFPTLYHQVVYDAGTTEPGSSGSPLLLGATQQVIGQLWGGDASCTSFNCADYYGRFDVTFPIVQSYLDPTPFVGFSQPSYSSIEGDFGVVTALVEVDLNRQEHYSAATVDVSVTGGTAVPGIDYEALPTTTLSFAPLVQTASFPIRIYSNTILQPDRTIFLTLGNPQGCALAYPPTATFTIVDDDSNVTQRVSALSVPFFDLNPALESWQPRR